MTVTLRIASAIMSRLRDYHLTAGKNVEALSYIWAQAYAPKENQMTIVIPHNAPLFLFAQDCFVRQSSSSVQLRSDVLNGLLVEFAASHFNCLINIHDHWFSKNARFSQIDDHDDDLFDRYLRESFEPMLEKHPHIGQARRIFNLSIVMGQKKIDARLVDTQHNPRFKKVGSIDILGEHFERYFVGKAKTPTFDSGVFDRQHDFIFPDKQALLADLQVALVGCGGLGSILAESLGRVGFRRFSLIDDDVINISNLNRWQGGGPESLGKMKAFYLADRMQKLFSHLDVEVKAINQSLYSGDAENAIKSSDLIIAGVDNDEARYYLNRAALQYSLPYFDAGVSVTGTGNTTDFHVRYFAILPGTTACMECTKFNLFDREKTLEAFLDDATAQSRRMAGYVMDQPMITTPSVYAINQRGASQLVLELLNYLCNWRPTARIISESWKLGHFQRCDSNNFPETSDQECPVCSYYAGAVDTEPLPKPRAFQHKLYVSNHDPLTKKKEVCNGKI